MKSHAIEISDLVFRYEAHGFELNIPDMTIRKGEQVAVVGASGCGKTTLAYLIAGIYTGTYEIDGVVVGETGYPTAGTLIFIGGEHTLMVTFNGTALVPVSVNGSITWMLNLSNGELAPYMPPTL